MGGGEAAGRAKGPARRARSLFALSRRAPAAIGRPWARAGAVDGDGAADDVVLAETGQAAAGAPWRRIGRAGAVRPLDQCRDGDEADGGPAPLGPAHR